MFRLGAREAVPYAPGHPGWALRKKEVKLRVELLVAPDLGSAPDTSHGGTLEGAREHLQLGSSAQHTVHPGAAVNTH